MASRRKTLAVMLAALVGLIGLARAGMSGARAADGATSSAAPVPARGRGDRCIAPTDWMRRNHMVALKHKRDQTVHEGVRTSEQSLKGCIDCHAVKGADGKAVTVDSPQHFCRTCHDYAAVSIDCFECHASRPGETGKSAAATPAHGDLAGEEAAALAQYVEGHGR